MNIVTFQDDLPWILPQYPLTPPYYNPYYSHKQGKGKTHNNTQDVHMVAKEHDGKLHKSMGELDSSVPLVVDLGTSELRAGFADEATPRLRYAPVIGRLRSRRDESRKIGPQVGESDFTRLSVRSPFDGELLSNVENLESVLDFTFYNLGFPESNSVDHPLVMTECIGNPNSCRAQTSELLFEAYGIPQVSYGIDALFSMYYNQATGLMPNVSNAMIVRSGYEATHIFPVLNGLPVLQQCSRISVGGSLVYDTLLSDLQMHYPQHKESFTMRHIREIIQRYCVTVPESYAESLKEISLYDVNNSIRKTSSPALQPVTIQLPYVVPEIKVITAEELQMREQKRKENAERLRAASAKKRDERVAQLQSDVTSYQKLVDARLAGTITESHFKSELKRGGFHNEADFNSTFDSLQKKLNRMLGKTDEVEEKKTEEEIYPLINIPDEELSAEMLKEKRRQKLLKAGFDARMRKKKEQEDKRSRENEAMALEEQERLADPVRYIAKLKSVKATIAAKRETRHRILQQMSSGSKRIDVASKKRMAIIARIAGEQSSRPNQIEDDDLFGVKDEDWQIYNTLAGNEESASEDEREELAQIELKLAQFDPDYVPEVTEPKHPVVTAEDYQIHLGVSRIRPPELIFQPSMLGLDEGGVPESLRRILVRVSPEEANQLAQNVFVTGGNTLFPNFDDRLRTELTSLRPVGSTIRIYHAQDSLLDAWRGASLLASLWAKLQPVDLNFITKRQYEECGSEYLTEHRFSNLYIPTPSMTDEQYEAARNRKRRR